MILTRVVIGTKTLAEHHHNPRAGADRRAAPKPMALLVKTPPWIRAGADRDRRAQASAALFVRTRCASALARIGIAAGASRLRPRRASTLRRWRGSARRAEAHGSARQNTSVDPRWRGSARRSPPRLCSSEPHRASALARIGAPCRNRGSTRQNPALHPRWRGSDRRRSLAAPAPPCIRAGADRRAVPKPRLYSSEPRRGSAPARIGIAAAASRLPPRRASALASLARTGAAPKPLRAPLVRTPPCIRAGADRDRRRSLAAPAPPCIRAGADRRAAPKPTALLVRTHPCIRAGADRRRAETAALLARTPPCIRAGAERRTTLDACAEQCAHDPRSADREWLSQCLRCPPSRTAPRLRSAPSQRRPGPPKPPTAKPAHRRAAKRRG